MKYKVGDKVVVVKQPMDIYEPTWINAVNRCAGNCFEIEYITNEGFYRLNGEGFMFLENWLVPLKCKKCLSKKKYKRLNKKYKTLKGDLKHCRELLAESDKAVETLHLVLQQSKFEADLKSALK